MGPFLAYGVMDPLPLGEPTPSQQRGQTAAPVASAVLLASDGALPRGPGRTTLPPGSTGGTSDGRAPPVHAKASFPGYRSSSIDTLIARVAAPKERWTIGGALARSSEGDERWYAGVAHRASRPP
jgi:hypothetical protein